MTSAKTILTFPKATHPNLPQGQPILTFPKGRNKLPCFVKDFFSH